MIIGDGVLTPAISGTSFCFPGFFGWLFTVVFCLAHVTNCAIFLEDHNKYCKFFCDCF
jgi:hypothetical protein